MTNTEIIKDFIKKVSHFMSDAEISMIMSKALGKKVSTKTIRFQREQLMIYNGAGRRLKIKKDRVGLDLFDHRLTKPCRKL